MAYEARRDVPRPGDRPQLGAKILRHAQSSFAQSPAKQTPTWRPPARESGIQKSEKSEKAGEAEKAGEIPHRSKFESGHCLAEEVTADLSKDPRRDQ